MRSVLRMFLMLSMAACLLSGVFASAQSLSEKLSVPKEGIVQMLTLDDGSTLVGKITEVGENEIKFETDLGEMTIAINKITGIREVEASSIRSGEHWFPDPNGTRLLFGPTARTLKAGTGYFVDMWVFFPGLAYGVTDNFSIGGGVSIIPGADQQLFYFTPKFGFSAGEKIDLAASVMAFRIWDETFYVGIGSLTYGTDDQSITCGLGTAWTNDEIADKPAATLGGQYRLSRRSGLVGESWYFPGEDESGYILMGALRLFGEKMAVDIGIAYSFEDSGDESEYSDDFEYDEEFDDDTDDDTNWIPYIDFVWNF